MDGQRPTKRQTLAAEIAFAALTGYMKIRFEKLSDWQRWPITSTRFLFPCVAIKGFKGNYRFCFAFWKWRKDISIQYNVASEPQRKGDSDVN